MIRKYAYVVRKLQEFTKKIFASLYDGGNFFMIWYRCEWNRAKDTAQKVHTVREDYPNIVFKDSWNEQCFQRCAWGLKRTEPYSEFQDNQDYDKESYEYLTLIDKTDVQSRYLQQVVLSPDENYILYVEKYIGGQE